MIFKKQGQHHGISKRVRLLAWLSILGWTCLIGALIIFHYARPEHEYGLLKYFGVEVRQSWIGDLTVWYLLLLSSSAAFSILSLFINRSRVKHHHRLRYNVVLLLLISTAMLVSYLVTT